MYLLNFFINSKIFSQKEIYFLQSVVLCEYYLKCNVTVLRHYFILINYFSRYTILFKKICRLYYNYLTDNKINISLNQLLLIFNKMSICLNIQTLFQNYNLYYFSIINIKIVLIYFQNYQKNKYYYYYYLLQIILLYEE